MRLKAFFVFSVPWREDADLNLGELKWRIDQ
jgi:hypothetical protein